MLTHEHVVRNDPGMGSTPCYHIARAMKDRDGGIHVERFPRKPCPGDITHADAKSIMDLMLMAAMEGDVLRFAIDGPDEDGTLEALKAALVEATACE